jgi:hypothetical protein
MMLKLGLLGRYIGNNLKVPIVVLEKAGQIVCEIKKYCVKEESSILQTIKRGRSNWLDHILLSN